MRWYYTKDRLARLVYIDVQPRNQSVYVNLGPAADFRVTLQVINLLPFAVEIDRAKIELMCGSSALEATNVERRHLQAGEISAVHFSHVIPDGHADQIAANLDSNASSLHGFFEINCRVHKFARRVPSLSGLNITAVNRHLRLPTQSRNAP
jgi:hypothetical protein